MNVEKIKRILSKIETVREDLAFLKSSEVGHICTERGGVHRHFYSPDELVSRSIIDSLILSHEKEELTLTAEANAELKCFFALTSKKLLDPDCGTAPLSNVNT